jgi:hypothetical protein
VRDECGSYSKTRAQWGGQVIYYNLCYTGITPMLTKHRLICAKTAMKHFSKASVYDSGNRQWAMRARVMCMCSADRAGRKKITSVCIWGGSSLGLPDSLHQERERLYTTEREEIIAAPGVLLLLLLLIPLPSLTNLVFNSRGLCKPGWQGTVLVLGQGRLRWA